MCMGKNFARSTKIFSDGGIRETGPRPRIGIREKLHVLLSEHTQRTIKYYPYSRLSMGLTRLLDIPNN